MSIKFIPHNVCYSLAYFKVGPSSSDVINHSFLCIVNMELSLFEDQNIVVHDLMLVN